VKLPRWVRRPTWRELLSAGLVITFFGAVAFVAINAGRGSHESAKNSKTAVVAKKRADVAAVKSSVATRKADSALQLNVKLVRCLTKRDAAALRRCLGLRPGAPGRPGAGGIPGTPGRTGPAGRGLRGPRGLTGSRGDSGAQGLPGVNGSKGDTGVPGRDPTSDEIAAAVAAYCADHDSCRGPAGKDGTTGAQGPAGATGSPGADGATGPQGPVGPQGEPGPAPTSLTCMPAVDPGTFTCVPN
jgi:hypothetical protein